jgi:hypothetical protein
MILLPTVYMGGRDVGAFLQRVAVSNATATYYRSFTVTFRGWHSIDLTASWDIFATHTASIPRSETQIRNGISNPDQLPKFTFAGDVPTTEVQGFDWAWRAQKVRTGDNAAINTLVIAPDSTSARRAVFTSNTVVGNWSWIRATTLHEAITQLGLLAGMQIELRIPDVAIAAQVLPPGQTIWDSILNLARPFAPEPYFRRCEDRMLLADRAAAAQGIGSSLGLSEDLVKSIDGVPATAQMLRRLLIGVPPWL